MKDGKFQSIAEMTAIVDATIDRLRVLSFEVSAAIERSIKKHGGERSDERKRTDNCVAADGDQYRRP